MIKMQLVEEPQVSLRVLSETLSPDALGAVMYTPQVLSDTQKAQARANIGIEGNGNGNAVFIGAIESSSSSYVSPTQVAEAVSKGLSVQIVSINEGITFTSFTVTSEHVFATQLIPPEICVLDEGAFYPVFCLVGNIKDDTWAFTGIKLPAETAMGLLGEAVTSYVDEQLGDISTALDGILAIQNELMGGDGV